MGDSRWVGPTVFGAVIAQPQWFEATLDSLLWPLTFDLVSM